MIRINLIGTKKSRAKSGVDAAVVELVVFGILVLMGFVGVFIWWSIVEDQIAEARRRINIEREELKKLPAIKKKLDEYKQKKKFLEEQLKIIASLQRNKYGVVRILDQISLLIPKEVWLTTIRQRGSTLHIKGEAESYEAVGSFMKQLEDSPFFSRVRLQNISLRSRRLQSDDKFRDIQFVEFSLKCSVKFSTSSS